MSLAWFLPLPGSYAGVDVVGVYNFACSLREVLAKHPFLRMVAGYFRVAISLPFRRDFH